MSSKLLPYGELRNANLIAKIGHGKIIRSREVGGKTVTGIQRLAARQS